MKIGFSFGRCIRDIVAGTVAQHDVMCIIARTRIEKVEQIEGVVDAYMHRPGYFMGLDRDECLRVAVELFNTGRIHQPRLYNYSPGQMYDSEIWMDLAPTANADNELVQTAWKNYQVAQRLVVDQAPVHRYAGESASSPQRRVRDLDDNF